MITAAMVTYYLAMYSAHGLDWHRVLSTGSVRMYIHEATLPNQSRQNAAIRRGAPQVKTAYSQTFENKSSLAPPNPLAGLPGPCTGALARDDAGAALLHPPKSSSAVTCAGAPHLGLLGTMAVVAG